MKHKFSVAVVAMVTALSLTFGLAACGGGEEPKADLWSMQRVYASAQELGFEGTLDELIAKFKGEKGETGADGVGVKEVSVNTEGELVIILTDGTEINCGNVKGEKGENGKDGKDATPCDHNYSEWELKLEPTCTSIGYSTRVCSVCGDTDYQFAEATGHSWNEGREVIASSCTEAGVKLLSCNVCGTVKSERLPLSDEHDYKGGICSVCGKNYLMELGLLVPINYDTILTNYNDVPKDSVTGYPHKSIDFGAEIGTEVRAAAAGTVHIELNSFLGNAITIDHGNGVKTFYWFIEPLEGLEEGDTVEAGEIIGEVAEQSHIEHISMGSLLHFELIVDEKSMDPMDYFKIEHEETQF